MEQLYRQDFDTFYAEKIEPIITPFEQKRVKIETRRNVSRVLTLVGLVLFFYLMLIAKNYYPIPFIFIFIILEIFYEGYLDSKFQKSFKKDVTSKVLSLFGNIYFSDKKNAIPYSDIKKWGLFPSSTCKIDDDVIIGLHQGCNFLINECGLYHQSSDERGRSAHIYDFSGLIVKIKMKKSFSGKTVVGVAGKVKKTCSMEDVNLESITFMINKKVYSTDQVEARYLLTTAFMERLDKLGDNFKYSNAAGRELTSEEYSARELSDLSGTSTDVSAVFVDGFVYLFVPTQKDFFEVDTSRTLLDADQFFTIYNEIISILGIIEFLKLDKNLGL